MFFHWLNRARIIRHVVSLPQFFSPRSDVNPGSWESTIRTPSEMSWMPQTATVLNKGNTDVTPIIFNVELSNESSPNHFQMRQCWDKDATFQSDTLNDRPHGVRECKKKNSDLKVTGCADMERIQLAQDRDQWRRSMNTIINQQVQQARNVPTIQ